MGKKQDRINRLVDAIRAIGAWSSRALAEFEALDDKEHELRLIKQKCIEVLNEVQRWEER